MSDEISGSSDILPGYHVILIVSLATGTESYSVSVSGKAKGTTATEGWSVSKPKGTKLNDAVLCIVLPIVHVLLLKK